MPDSPCSNSANSRNGGAIIEYYLGIDIGTSGTKALLINRDGKAIASSTDTYPLSTPKPLWAEQDPEDWWRATSNTIREILSNTGINPQDIKGVGLSGQMHGAVFLDAGCNVLRPSIIWCDQRTQKECDWITETMGLDRIVEFISNPVLTGFTAGKIIWVRNNEPHIYEKINKVLLPKDFIRLRLTGIYASEVSDASGTALFNVRKRSWSDEMLDGIGIPKSWMPNVYESPEISGRISQAGAAATGLAVGTPVVGGGGDQASGAVGNGIVSTGIVSSTIGTSGVVFAFADEPVVDPKLRVHTFCHAVPGKWHVMGVVQAAGGSLKWYRDTFADPELSVARETGIDAYDLIGRGAENIPPGAEGLLFLPYLTGERTPYADPDARGVFFGATLRHHKAHFARSIYEGVAFALRDSFEIFKEMNVEMNEVRSSGGGAKSPLWRQIQSDVTGIGHSLINVDEGPAFGVALLAAVGTGAYKSVEEACESTVKVISSIDPNYQLKSVYDEYYKIYQNLYASLKDQFKAVSAIVTQE